MNIERYTDRAKGFVQAAQNLALREDHQQFTPEHILKVLLDDPEGLAANLIARAGGHASEALQSVEDTLARRPKISGACSWHSQWNPRRKPPRFWPRQV